MITIYHNSRCDKSREGLCEIEILQQPVTIRNYMIDHFTSDELKGVIKKIRNITNRISAYQRIYLD